MRNKKHNPKVSIAIGILLFVGITVMVINAQDMKPISRVKVSNQKIVINQGDTEFSNTQVEFNNNGNLNNQNFNADNTNVNINNSGNFNNINGNFNNNGEFNNINGNFNNAGTFENQNTNFNNIGGNYNNNGNIRNQNSNYGNYNNINSQSNNVAQYDVGFGNQDYRSNPNRYKYQDIDWSVWKSNFVNRILDDSMYIKSLDLYGVGTWFYYSFNVTDAGEIKDVTVFSFYLSEKDKKQIRDLIRSYAHQPITIFPKDSKRKKAKVKAIMLLGDTESKSDASNFNDIEKIKIKY